MHTHPAAWEPSQSSPDDFKVMHGLFINHGVRDFFTIIADRIDWFRVKKKDQIPLEEMVEVIEEFEEDIEKEFHIAEEAFQRKMGDKPYLTSEQTRYITEHFNKKIPEFQMSYRAYALSPQQMNGRSVPIHLLPFLYGSSEVIDMAVNQFRLTRSALHYAGGVGMKVVGLNPPTALTLAVLWEFAEPPLKKRYPEQFPHPSWTRLPTSASMSSLR